MCETNEEKDKLCFMRFKQIDNALANNFNIEMKELDLTKTQTDVIRFLNDNSDKKNTQRDIELGLKLSNPTISGILNRMEEKGFVKRVVDESNKKCKIIELTHKSHETLIQIKSKAILIETRMSEGMTMDEKILFNRLMDLVLYNLEHAKEDKNNA